MTSTPSLLSMMKLTVASMGKFSPPFAEEERAVSRRSSGGLGEITAFAYVNFDCCVPQPESFGGLQK